MKVVLPSAKRVQVQVLLFAVIDHTITCKSVCWGKTKTDIWITFWIGAYTLIILYQPNSFFACEVFCAGHSSLEILEAPASWEFSDFSVAWRIPALQLSCRPGEQPARTTTLAHSFFFPAALRFHICMWRLCVSVSDYGCMIVTSH